MCFIVLLFFYFYLKFFQVSGDERKRLCEHVKPSDSGLTLYGSLTYQLNHANMESTGIFDFIIKALSIIHRTGEFHEIISYYQTLVKKNMCGLFEYKNA